MTIAMVIRQTARANDCEVQGQAQYQSRTRDICGSVSFRRYEGYKVEGRMASATDVDRVVGFYPSGGECVVALVVTTDMGSCSIVLRRQANSESR